MNKILRSHKSRLMVGLFVLSLLFFVLAKIIPSGEEKVLREKMVAASRIMAHAMEVLRECREERGIKIDPAADVNLTGIIGIKTSPITTTLGNLQAKRTSTNPNFAGLAVLLLEKAGVHPGDTIAVGASRSFPGLLLAVLSASKAMDLEPLVLISLGASQWGANRPDFNLLHMMKCSRRYGIFPYRPIGVSVGGDQDTGRDMTEQGRALLAKEIKEAGFPVLSKGNLAANVESRMRLYFQEASGEPIGAFVNIGGSWANLGVDSSILYLKPGLGKIKHLPPDEKRGVIYTMAALDIPVIHLLYVHGLIQKYGLKWDPTPLPRPGEGGLYRYIRERQRSFLFLSLIYLILVGGLLGFGLNKST